MKKQKMIVAVVAAIFALNGVWAETETVGGVAWIYFVQNGDDVMVEGLGEEVLSGKVMTPPANLTLSLGDGFEGIAGVQATLLPDGQTIKGGAKWDVGTATIKKPFAAATVTIE